ncbi:complement C1q-like protein 4 [Parambassis ranga]|uniref:Complement C1q-like protein 4 n=1 Tax=Parambassis ranga TaxID=210632 RepID=A0A6P7JNA3_9TELE|nr:complement C1q-like protein 4 [Parambassis ranga]
MKITMLLLLLLLVASVSAQSAVQKVEIVCSPKENAVAFSASLVVGGELTLGPFDKHTVLVFKHVVTNIGNAYSPETGLFTAPVTGAYHFEWYIGVHGPSPTSAGLFKNSDQIFLAWEQQTAGLFGTAANGVMLQLKAGDQVSVRLWAGTKIFDNLYHHTTFSGHLLFTM